MLDGKSKRLAVFEGLGVEENPKSLEKEEEEEEAEEEEEEAENPLDLLF